MKTGEKSVRAPAAIFLAAALAVAGCQALPEDRAHRGAAVGGAAGAAVGGVVGGWEGAVLGGLLGAGGGYVIGAEQERVRRGDEASAQEAAQSAEQQPATVAEAREAETADINNDGFVTLDEVIAMNEAGFSDEEMIERLEATNQVFELTPGQEDHLAQQGVSQEVIDRMSDVNRHLYGSPRDEEVIGRDPNIP